MPVPPHIVVLNGPPAVGKTTVAAHLTALLPGTVSIAGDALRSFAPADAVLARATLGAGSTYHVGAHLATEYLRLGAPRVVFEYVFERPDQLTQFETSVASGIPIYLFTLWAPLAVLRARDSGRVGHARLDSAVDACFVRMEQHMDSLGELVDAEGLRAEAAAERVHEGVRRGVGRRHPANLVAAL